MKIKKLKNLICALVIISFLSIFIFQFLDIGGIVSLFFTLIIFSFLLSFCVYKIFTEHLDLLMEGVKNITAGNLKYVIKIDSKDKCGKLASAFNEMTSKLRDARERDEAINQMKSEFIAIAAHQMRTPMTGTKWTLRMLLDGDVGEISEEQRSMLEKSLKNNERMIDLVNDLLNVSNIEEGRFKYNFGEYYIEEIIDKILNVTAEEIKKREMKIKVNKPKQPVKIRMDKEKISSALANILDNSLKYTESGGTINIDIVDFKKKVVITFKDNGFGIPENELGRIFTKFYRGSNIVKMEVNGSGLGLFISKNIIEKHKGKIELESVEGKGTKVIITLPITQ